jgi:secreted PhoX family phosphatase
VGIKLKRRTVLEAGLAASAALLLTSRYSDFELFEPESPIVNFKSLLRSEGFEPRVVVSPDYDYQILIPWGDPINPEGPSFSYPPSANDQALQLGGGHDGMTFFPIDQANNRGLLCLNHEFVTNIRMRREAIPKNLEQIRASQHAHGIGIVELENRQSKWRVNRSEFARRIHANTPIRIAGPLSGHRLVSNDKNNPVLGTLGNCANGETPWGTYLSCEENFNWYFGSRKSFEPTTAQLRYGLNETGGRFYWHLFDERFDLNNPAYLNESNRFGWVVEVDPFSPDEPPVKRTALGRFKHESISVVMGRGDRPVCYMGDDGEFEFVYKFVSSRSLKETEALGTSSLDEGTLYVAKFEDDGTGLWLPLTMDNPTLAEQFEDLADILVHARLAGSVVGATPMDRPEWTTVAPDGQVYISLTKNASRATADAANPVAPNFHGHIIRLIDADEHVGEVFVWDTFLVAEDSFDTQNSFSNPDSLWADPDGRLFVATAGSQNDGMNNQLLVVDTDTLKISRLMFGVPGCEITGFAATPDRTTMFVNVQHPGPRGLGEPNFPEMGDSTEVPRDATIAIKRKDGGIVGS